ncbi:MAG: hypothetical protein KTR25_09555 [Myxococcales bacterium]|nr:hypothetical protein [Myxococcales bacterium]
MVTISLGLGCVSGARSAPQNLNTVGFSGHIANTSLARTTAQNRAIEGLHKLLNPIQFEWRIGRLGQQLTLNVPITSLEGVHTKLRALTNGQWMAIAHLPHRPPMDALPSYFSQRFRASASIRNQDFALAHRIAESRAIRGLLTKVFGRNLNRGLYAGELRLQDMSVSRSGKTITVSIDGYAVLDSSSNLNQTDHHIVLLSAVEEYRALHNNKRLILALEALGKKEMALRLPHAAANRFREAGELAARKRTYFYQMELRALKAWGSKSAYPRMRILRAAINSEANSSW